MAERCLAGVVIVISICRAVRAKDATVSMIQFYKEEAVKIGIIGDMMKMKDLQLKK